MRINFDQIKRDSYGRIEAPVLQLLRPHGSMIGPLGHYFDLNAKLKFNETSEVSFQYPRVADRKRTPLFDKLVPGKLIQMDPYGVFVVAKVVENGEGDRCVHEVTAYSREYELAGKQVVFAAGTYNFWNPADVENSMLGILLSYIRNWKIGSVSPSLIGRYRTFDDVDEKALDFMLNKLQETYGCIFDFDTYNRVVNVIDANEDTVMVPVYLSSQNLIKEASVDTNAENVITKLYVSGAEGVSIRNVNPTGDSYIYNLDYYISIGDIPEDLANKWVQWQNELFANQPYYTSLVALRNSTQAQITVERATLVDYKNELAILDNTRATFLQMMQTAKNDDTKTYFQERLNETAVEYSDWETKISEQENTIEALEAEYKQHCADIAAMNNELRLSSYFTSDELDILDNYFAEDAFTDETFAVFDVDVSGADDYVSADDVTISFTSSGQEFKLTSVPCEDHVMASLSGGTVTITGADYDLTGTLVSGILDHKEDRVTCSLYLSAGTMNGTTFPSGSVTCVIESSYDDDAMLAGMDEHEDTISNGDNTVSHTTYFYTGSTSITGTNAKIYFTRNVTDYQQYAVEQELYDYATTVLEDSSSPTYEFEISSGNLFFEKKFDPFRKEIQLGRGVYVDLDDRVVLKPLLLEIHLYFEDPDKFDLIFSNTFKRHDSVNKLKDLVKEATSMSRTLQMNKHAFGESHNTTTWVKNLLDAGYDAAMTQIMAGNNQIVSIDQAGIKVDSEDGKTRIYLNNGMIALYDKETNTVSMGLGRFYNEATGTDFVGILADIIGGTLLAGQNLIIECPDPNGGVMQFKVDSSGVIINNGRMYMKSDLGAMGWDANYGFFAGTKDLFTTTDTGHVLPTCIDEDGSMIFDDDNWPQDVNVWIGIDGKVYIRGNIYAEDGVFNGTVYAKAGEFNGTINATDGIFKGTVQANKYLDSTGTDMMENGRWKSDYLDLGNIQLDGTTGDITLTGNINLSNGHITWGNNSPVQYQFSENGVSGWHSTMTDYDYYRRDSLDGGVTWGDPYQFRGTDGQNGENGSDANIPSYIELKGLDFTDISSSYVRSPVIEGGTISGAEIYGGAYYDLNQSGKLTLSSDERSYAWLNFSSAISGREMFSVGGTDFGEAKDVTLMTFTDKTIFQCYSSTGIITMHNVDISSLVQTAIDNGDVVVTAKFK